MLIPLTKPICSPTLYCSLTIARDRVNPLNSSHPPESRVKGLQRVVSLSLGNRSAMKSFDIYVIYVWDKHAELAQKTLKANLLRGVLP